MQLQIARVSRNVSGKGQLVRKKLYICINSKNVYSFVIVTTGRYMLISTYQQYLLLRN